MNVFRVSGLPSRPSYLYNKYTYVVRSALYVKTTALFQYLRYVHANEHQGSNVWWWLQLGVLVGVGGDGGGGGWRSILSLARTWDASIDRPT